MRNVPIDLDRLRAYCERGVTDLDAAARLGVERDSVRKAARSIGIKLIRALPSQVQHETWTPPVQHASVWDWAAGITLRDRQSARHVVNQGE